MKSIFKIVSIVIILLLVSCNNNDAKSATNDTTKPIAVKVATVVDAESNPYVTASGKIQAINSAELSTRMMGFVTKTYKNVGDKVTNGELLLAINNTDLQAKKAQIEANIIKAEAAFKNAEKDYNRFKNLIEENSASQKEMDDITANYNIAKANLQAAKQMKNEINAQFAYANIRAPFSGVVTNKFVKEGDMANPGMPLISVEGKEGFEVIAMVPESEISKIKTNSKVDVIVKAINKTLQGMVTEVSSSAKNTGGQYLVKIKFDENNKEVLSGMFATVQFPVEKTKSTTNLIIIPKSVLVKKGELQGIYTVSKSSTALLRWLRLGNDFNDKVEVLSGLSDGEQYIVSSQGKLYNGAKITVQ